MHCQGMGRHTLRLMALLAVTVLIGALTAGCVGLGPSDEVVRESIELTITISVPPGADKEPTVNYRPGLDGRAVPPTASDSNSNNRFVAVTSPVGSGESILFLIDSDHDQLLAYRFLRRKGLQFVAARKIDYDLKISSYKDLSEFTRDDMKRLWNKQRSKELRK